MENMEKFNKRFRYLTDRKYGKNITDFDCDWSEEKLNLSF